MKHKSIFVAGVFVGITVAVVMGIIGFSKAADLLSISNVPRVADAVVVLGGGDGSRLRKAIELYDYGLGGRLILVDTKKQYWQHITRNLCPDCDLQGKEVSILEGSVSTTTDAELSLAFCRVNRIGKIVVVTSPYHTRRADLTFRKVFRSSGIDVQTVGTGDFGGLLSPSESWWRDRKTLETIWMELGKIIYLILEPLLPARGL